MVSVVLGCFTGKEKEAAYRYYRRSSRLADLNQQSPSPSPVSFGLETFMVVVLMAIGNFMLTLVAPLRLEGT